MNATLSAWLVNPVTLTLVAAAIAGFFVVVELLLSSLARLGNVRFQGVVEDHPKILTSVVDHDTHLSTVTDLLRLVGIAALGCLWLVIGQFQWPEIWQGVGTAVITSAILVLLARVSARSLSEDSVARLLRLVSPVLGPLLRIFGRVPQADQPVTTAEDEDEEASEREIQAYLEAGQAAGIFEGEEGEFVESLVDFFDTVVREVMTPRTEMETAPDTISFSELLQTFAETLKSRIPIFHETVDKIIGVVHVKNCVQYAISGHQPPVTELLNPCIVVPESKPLGELLRDFQQNQQQMAIVVDEYGGTSGLVTLEDILEEIVGEIEDEHETKQPPEWQELEPGVYRLQGRASLETLGELFEKEIDDEDMDTVGGLVFSRHGTVPDAGTLVHDPLNGLVFVVEEMDERRIVSVTARCADEPAVKPEE